MTDPKQRLADLRTGRATPPQRQEILQSPQAFADCGAEDLIWTVAHNDAEIRQFGLAALRACRDESKGAKIMDAAQNERRPAVAEAYMQVLRSVGPEAVFGALGKMINDKNAATRRKALELLISVDGWPKQRAQVVALLEDPDPSVSEATLRAVVQTAPRAYLGQLRVLAHHDGAEVRTLALQAIIQRNHIEDAGLLLHRLALETGDLKKQLFDVVVGFIRSQPDDMTQVIVAGIATTEPMVIKTALDFFLKLPDKRGAIRTFLQYADSVAAGIRAQLFNEAAKQADAFVAPIMDVIKNEQDQAIRVQAVNLAKELNHPKLAPVFMHELKNPDWLIRYTAMQTLAAMKSPEALPHIVKALENEETSMAAIQAMDTYRDIRLAKPFLQKLHRAFESEQVEILKALRNLADARLIQPMSQFLESNAPKGKAKLFAAEQIIDLCKETAQAVPPKVTQIHDSLRSKSVDDLPDLGLKLADDA